MHMSVHRVSVVLVVVKILQLLHIITSKTNERINDKFNGEMINLI